jgi:hypothetical protein
MLVVEIVVQEKHVAIRCKNINFVRFPLIKLTRSELSDGTGTDN